MHDTDLRNLMILIAVATPVIGALILSVGRWAARAGEQPVPRGLVRNAWILIVAGPVNLLLWFLFNGVMDGVGSRNAVGLAMAALVFVAAGFTTGLFSRLARRGEGDDTDRKDAE